ncbi:MAG: uracil-DNA glycosylase [Chloroflexi bacterium]|nr:uracil-DNA glycosylase [Chloroflexota bacterium]
MNRAAQFADLQMRMRACRACLNAGYYVESPAVTQGMVSAQVMTIGQAPGITEVEAARPFNAGSGSRLFQWLGEAGIKEDWFRSTQYMSSVTKCYPGRVAGGSGDRVPSRAEQMLCHPFLVEELALVAPKLVVPIGGLAIKLFFPKHLRLDEIIGTEIERDGRWIVPLPHPSGASRWHQIEANRPLIERAIRLIGKRFKSLNLL